MIKSFKGQYAFLSNFYESPFSVDGITYPTVEHYFQAQKTLDIDERRKIATASTPGKAKRLGRQVKLRPDWEEVKDEVMKAGLRIKFSNPVLREKLLNTGDESLEEGNWWHDNYWGVCYCEKCQDRIAHNHLGKALIELRDVIQTM